MRLFEVVGLDEDRGAGSFDYKYWFWGKKDSVYGIGYARQPIELDVQRRSGEAINALENIKKATDGLGDEEPDDRVFDVIEKKVKANTKRLVGIIDLFGAPIVINWLNRDPSTTVIVQRERKGDVTDETGATNIDVLKFFRDPETHEMLTRLDWSNVKINDQEGDTLNTVIAKFVKDVFGGRKKSARTYARGKGVEGIMQNLKFKDKGIQVVSFRPQDYKLFPKEILGSKKMVEYFPKLVDENFAKVLKSAREVF
jgi:hypothetical protein